MKIEDIVIQLRKYLPLHTDSFTDQLDVASITSSGTTATVTTNTIHGLSTGNFVLITGALVPNPIVTAGLTESNGIAHGITEFDHDLTMRYRPVTVIGADLVEYNGTHELLSVPNRREFTYAILEFTPSPASGNINILENLNVQSYNGRFDITVTSPTTFTYQLERTLRSPAYGAIKIHANPRIVGVADQQEAYQAYTKKSAGKLWAFVVVDALNASKDRSVSNDDTANTQNGSIVTQIILQQFHVYVFYPRLTDVSGRRAKDAGDNLLALLCNALIKVKFPHSSLAVKPDSGAVFVTLNSGFIQQINPPVFVNDFVFEQSGYIDTRDAFRLDKSIAFRDIDAEIKFSLSTDNQVKMTAEINLDEKPINP